MTSAGFTITVDGGHSISYSSTTHNSSTKVGMYYYSSDGSDWIDNFKYSH